MLTLKDSQIILNYLKYTYPNEHIVIYLYCCGGELSSINAINKIKPDVYKVFNKLIEERFLYETIKNYLEFKKHQFINGEIKINPVYL
jgi:hypothetical protein